MHSRGSTQVDTKFYELFRRLKQIDFNVVSSFGVAFLNTNWLAREI